MGIVKKDAYFKSSTGMNNIHCCIWEPETEPKGVVQLAHGVAEHIERYDRFARFLCDNGYVVCGNDHLGHGKSVESLVQLGFFADDQGDKRLVEDMHILASIMHRRYPSLPYFLFGHSMGSLCARVYAAQFGEELSGVVFCGTGQLPSALLLAKDPIDSLTERFGVAAPIPGNVFALVNKLAVKNPRTENDWLSVNEENVDKYNQDPLCGFPLRLGGLRDLLTLSLNACSDSWAGKVPMELPILMISGAKDPVGFNGKGVIDVCDKLEKVGHQPEVILYPGDRHEILNEDDSDRIFNDVLAWLTRQAV